jgi:hypothetical protein
MKTCCKRVSCSKFFDLVGKDNKLPQKIHTLRKYNMKKGELVIWKDWENKQDLHTKAGRG